MKILIVEDDKNLNNTMAEALKAFADVVQVFDGEEALFQAEQNIFDLIILDVMLPYVDGFTILETIRKNSNVPVLMVTAKTMVEDRVKGLNLGADDYLTKPFYRDELVARVEALLRRYNNNFDGLKLVFKDLEFDIVHKIVRINGENINLNGKIYDILEYLIRNKDIIIPKEQLFNRIWGFESDTVWSVVEVYVSNLRKVLKDYDYAKYLKTVRNVGYMWSEKE